MVSDLGIASGTSAPPGSPARRVSRPGWRDPRLWVGLVLVAGSIIVGARVMAAADESVRIWAAGSDLAPGTAITQADLVATAVRFSDENTLGGYLAVQEPLPEDLRFSEAVAAGDLVPRSALSEGERSGVAEVPVAVEPEQVPPSVSAGSVVDVYLLGSLPVAGDRGDGSTSSHARGPILTGVAVLEAPSIDAGFGSTGRRQLVLAVPEAMVADFFAALDSVDNPALTVVRRG